MKYRDVIKLIEDAGWVRESTRGSHIKFAHPTLSGKITVPGGGKLGRDVPPGTLRSILKQANLWQDDP